MSGIEPGEPHQRPAEGARHGRLSFRPTPVRSPSARTGLLRLQSDTGSALAYVPTTSDAGAMRIVVLLHGAGARAAHGLELLMPVAEEHRLLLLAPKSQQSTWDVIVGGYGGDVVHIDGLLHEVTAAYPLQGLALAGFSDGASYALSLGLSNGDVVDAVIAFSPGFAAPLVEHGRPRLFVSHGVGDRVLPIDRCSRALVPRLQRAGYPVTYEEFDGGHTVPAQVLRRAARWLSDAR